MPNNRSRKTPQAHNVGKIFNYIGGILIFLGISYLLFSNWFVLASVMRVLLTLGIACWALILGASLSRQENNTASGAAFFLLGGLLLPLGVSVTINAIILHPDLAIANIVNMGVCFLVFLLLQLRFPREILLFFSIVFGSLFFIAISNYFYDEIYWFSLIDYQLLILGICYLLAGYAVSFRENGWKELLYFFGDLFMLYASFQLAGLLFQNGSDLVVWQFGAPALLLLSFILSIPLKSKSVFYISVLFLIIYITSMTHKFSYLFGPLGWPVILIAAGFVLMFLGYLFASSSKKKSKD